MCFRYLIYTWELLVELSNGETGAHRAVKRVALWEAGRRWLRAGHGGAQWFYRLTTWLLYLTLLPLVPLVWLVRPQLRRWHPKPRTLPAGEVHKKLQVQ